MYLFFFTGLRKTLLDECVLFGEREREREFVCVCVCVWGRFSRMPVLVRQMREHDEEEEYIFDSSVNLEGSHLQQGFEDGFRDGVVAGKDEGREVGLKTGFELG